MMSQKDTCSNLRVLELASVLAGPSVGMFFAELGATVVKVENLRTRGDVTRRWKLPTEPADTDISAYFSCVNWGKLSIGVDLTNPGGLDIVHGLVGKSDIVLASYKPGDAEKLGVDYETLSKLNPELIYAHVTGYGPKVDRPGYDAIIQAESGFTYMNGEPDGGPVKMPVALMDVLAAHQIKEGILLALLRRQTTGRGDYVSVSLMQAGIASLVNQATNWLVGGKIPGRMGSDHPNIVPYGTIFHTSDGREIVLGVGTDRQFSELCDILGIPEVASDERFVTNQARVRHREELKPILQEYIARFSRDELLEKLNEKNVPAGGVYNMKEVFQRPEAIELLLEHEFPSGKLLKGVRSAVFVPGNMADGMKPPPHYGEHTRPVLKNLLGLDDSKIEDLYLKGAID